MGMGRRRRIKTCVCVCGLDISVRFEGGHCIPGVYRLSILDGFVSHGCSHR